MFVFSKLIFVEYMLSPGFVAGFLIPSHVFRCFLSFFSGYSWFLLLTFAPFSPLDLDGESTAPSAILFRLSTNWKYLFDFLKFTRKIWTLQQKCNIWKCAMKRSTNHLKAWIDNVLPAWSDRLCTSTCRDFTVSCKLVKFWRFSSQFVSRSSTCDFRVVFSLTTSCFSCSSCVII